MGREKRMNMQIRLRYVGRNDMAWVAVHKNGEEGIFANKPSRGVKLEW